MTSDNELFTERRNVIKSAALGGAVGLAGYAGGGSGVVTQDGDAITLALQESIVAQDFALTYDFTTNKATNSVWDTLMGFSFDDTPKLEKGLAKSVEQKSNTTYEYTIRDATFHNGETVTAGDVKASYERIRDPDIGSPLKWTLSDLKEGDQGIEVVDEKTIRFNLQRQIATWQFMPAIVGIGPKSAIEEHGADFGRTAETTIGSGPYQVESWQQGSEIVLTKFPEYRDPDFAHIDTVTVKIVPEGAARVTGLKTGEIDVVGEIPPQQWGTVENLESARMETGTTWLEFKLSMQNQREPFKSDKNLRKALAYATNWEPILKNVYRDTAVRQEGPLPQNMRWHNDDLDLYEHDPEKAKQLYEESGGIDREIEFIATSGTSGRVAVVVQSQWQRALPVSVNVNKQPYEQLLPKIKNGEYDVQLDGWASDYPDPDGQLFSQYHSDNWPPQNNESWYENEQVDKLLEDARGTLDSAKRETMYKEVQKVIHDDVPAIWGVVVEQGFGVRNELTFPKVTPMWFWQDLISRIERK